MIKYTLSSCSHITVYSSCIPTLYNLFLWYQLPGYVICFYSYFCPEFLQKEQQGRLRCSIPNLNRFQMINIVSNGRKKKKKISSADLLHQLAEGFVCVSRWGINGPRSWEVQLRLPASRHRRLKHLSTDARCGPKVTNKYVSIIVKLTA